MEVTTRIAPGVSVRGTRRVLALVLTKSSGARS